MIAVFRPEDVASLGGLHHQYLPPRHHLQRLHKFLYLPRQTQHETEANRQSGSTADEDKSRLTVNADKVVISVLLQDRTSLQPQLHTELN